jgi:tol-pal system protein YbgF
MTGQRSVDSADRGRSAGARASAAAPAPRYGWRRASFALLGVAVLLSGCATKKDLKLLREEVLVLQARQDSAFVESQRRDRALLDSLTAATALLVRLRGDLGHQIVEIGQQLIQVQELAGQSAHRLADLRAQLENRSQALETVPGGGSQPAGGGDPDRVYQMGLEQLQRGSYGTARVAFEQVIRQDPSHPRAIDAQFQIAESFATEGQHDRALQEFERLVEQHPGAERAPQALFRAGTIAEERGTIPQARRYFDRIVRSYPNSDAAAAARDRLRRLPAR